MKIIKPKEISIEAENKIRELFISGGYTYLKEKGFGLLKDEPKDNVIPKFEDLIKKVGYRIEKKKSNYWELKYSYMHSYKIRGGSENNILEEIYGTARIYFMNKYDSNKPLLIFHHSFLVTNHELHLKTLVNKEMFERFNVVSIGLNAHTSFSEIVNRFIPKFMNSVCSIAGSVLAMEEVIKLHNYQSTKKAVIVGVSIGGIIASWHHLIFDSANIYFPVISQPNLGVVLINENLKDAIYNYDRIKDNPSYLECFKPTSRPADSVNKVFPIIATEDQLMKYDVTANAWKGYEVMQIDTGHYSYIIKSNEIRKYILGKLG